jgi:HemY protein
MKRVFLLVLAVVLVALAASWLRQNPGTVAVEWLGWRADTSVAMLALTLALITGFGAAGYRFWGYLKAVPTRVIRARRARRQRRGYAALSAGMIAVASGDADEAGRQARLAEGLLQDLGLTRLLCAQAAQLSGDEATARGSYEALMRDPDTALIGVQGLREQAEARGERGEALRLAEKAYELEAGSPSVLRRLLALQAEFGQWAAADRLLEDARRKRVLPAGEAKQARAAVLMERARSAEADGEVEAALVFARDGYGLEPARVPAAAGYARVLGLQGREKRAAKILEKAWAADPHPDIAEAYDALYDAEDPLARVKRLQRLLSFRPDHVEGHLALAAAALRARLWGEARAHLGEAANRALTPRVCRLFAELEESERNDADAARRWLTRASSAEPDPAWVCESCGAVSGAWSARCGNCNDFDSLQWRAPPRVSRLPATTTPAVTGPRADDAA